MQKLQEEWLRKDAEKEKAFKRAEVTYYLYYKFYKFNTTNYKLY